MMEIDRRVDRQKMADIKVISDLFILLFLFYSATKL